MSLVRVYGPSIGWSSFKVVTKGMLDGLSSNKILTHFDPIDTPDEDEVLRWNDEPVALVCGPPQTFAIGNVLPYREKLMLLALNSTKLSPQIAEVLKRDYTGILTPSQWCADSLSDVGLPVTVVPHGVWSGYTPLSEDERSALEWFPLYECLHFPDRKISALHLAESSLDRKGTWPLIEAWRNCFGPESVLTIVCNNGDASGLQLRLDDEFPNWQQQIRVLTRFNFPPAQMRLVYNCFDFVVQPSRSEAFGLVPLEALCCGVPVVITTETGHTQWCYEHGSAFNAKFLLPGVVNVSNGVLAPADFDGCGEAPIVSADEIAKSLISVREQLPVLKDEAQAHALQLQAKWNWSVATKPWIDELKGKYS